MFLSKEVIGENLNIFSMFSAHSPPLKYGKIISSGAAVVSKAYGDGMRKVEEEMNKIINNFTNEKIINYCKSFLFSLVVKRVGFFNH